MPDRDLGLPPAFRARFPWLGGDLQTVKAFLDPRRTSLKPWPGRRLWLAMADGSGDRLAASLHAEARCGSAPLVVLVHGLTGCEDSRYMLDSARHFLAAGYPVLRLNLRGAGPSGPTCREQYHAGRSRDLRDAINALDDLVPGLLRRGLFPIGYSLGANMLLKFLAEYATGFPVLGAVSVSAPIDLKAAQERLMAPRNRVYHRYLLKRMIAEAVAEGSGLSLAERETVRGCETVFDFDDRLTAPRNGFQGADDYYRRNSAKRFLTGVTTPCLAIHARDDPWIPVEMYLAFDWRLTPAVRPVLPESGGHVGFHGGGASARWNDRCALAFLQGLLGRRGVGAPQPADGGWR